MMTILTKNSRKETTSINRPRNLYTRFIVNILEGAIQGKMALGRPRLNYMKRVMRIVGVTKQSEIKKLACEDVRCTAAHYSNRIEVEDRVL